MIHPEASLYPYVTDELDVDARREVDAHLAACNDCRRAVAEIAEMHAALVAIPEPAADEPFVARVQSAVRLAVLSDVRVEVPPHVLHPSTFLHTRGAIAAIVLIALAAGAAGGWFWRDRASSPSSSTAATTSDRYMVLFYEPLERRVAEPIETRRDRIRRFSEWGRPIALEGRMISGVRLRDEGGRLYRSASEVDTMDAAVPPGLALTGFLLFRAGSYEDAARFVAGCPLFEDGGRVELRRAF
jgi:hypothetical protein